MVLQILLRVSELNVLAECFGFYIAIATLIILIFISDGGDNNTPKTT